jgi:hypothetical protein
MASKKSEQFQQFDCEDVPLAPGTGAEPREDRAARQPNLSPSPSPSESLCFDCESVDMPQGTLAVPRPIGREREPIRQ